jgi:hypothetical protein
MWGFGLGVLGLSALWAVLQPKSASNLAGGGNVIVSILSRMISPNVAGLPQTKAAKAASKTAGGTAPGITPAAGALLNGSILGGTPLIGGGVVGVTGIPAPGSPAGTTHYN